MTSVFVQVDGKRLATKVTPMQKLQVIVDQIVRQIKPQPDLADCKLLINGKQADLDLQYRFASLGPSSKLVLQTGQPNRLGVSETVLRQSNAATSDHRHGQASAVPLAKQVEPISSSPQQAPQSAQGPGPEHSAQAGTGSAAAQSTPRAPEGSLLRQDEHQSALAHSSGFASGTPVVRPDNSEPASTSSHPMADRQPAERAEPSDSTEPRRSPAQPVETALQSSSLPQWCHELGLDREVSLFTLADLESSGADQLAEDPTDEFYEFGVEDYARVMQGLQRKKKHAEKGLRTAKLREQEEQAMAAKFPQTLIRVVFPSREIVQVQFASQETVALVSQTLRKCLMPGVAASNWYLYTAPPKQVLKDASSTLYRAGLCPAAKLYFGSELLYKDFLRPEVRQARGPVPKAVHSGGTHAASESLPSQIRSSDSTAEKRISDKSSGPEKKLPKWMMSRR